MIYEVWYKNGVDLDYFGSREAAEMYLEKYIAKINSRWVNKTWTEEDFEIREKEEPVNNKGDRKPMRNWPASSGCDYGIGG